MAFLYFEEIGGTGRTGSASLNAAS